MAKKIKLGDYNRLRIVKKVDFGLYLDGGDEGEILLPSRYVPENVGIGDELDVFLYLDQEERLIATTGYWLSMITLKPRSVFCQMRRSTSSPCL